MTRGAQLLNRSPRAERQRARPATGVFVVLGQRRLALQSDSRLSIVQACNHCSRLSRGAGIGVSPPGYAWCHWGPSGSWCLVVRYLRRCSPSSEFFEWRFLGCSFSLTRSWPGGSRLPAVTGTIGGFYWWHSLARWPPRASLAQRAILSRRRCSSYRCSFPTAAFN